MFQAYLVDGLARWNEDRYSAATSEEKVKPQSYSGLLRHTANILGEEVMGKKFSSSYCSPRKYTAEETSPKHVIETQASQPPDMTPIIEKNTDMVESVGPDNIEGFGRVQELAEYLVGLRSHSYALTMDQASEIVRLWNALADYDKRRTVFSPRHRTTQTKGRFRATKKNVAPGVESTRRCFLGPNTGPAQCPDCNRYVEAVITKLCELQPSSQRSTEGTQVTRWTLVCRSYNHIRQCVLCNSKVMLDTNIQLPAINKATLTQWYNRRGKMQEKDILRQGIAFQQPRMTAEKPLPSPLPKPADLQTGTVVNRYHFPSPPDTAGTAKIKRRCVVNMPQTGTATSSILPFPNPFILTAPTLPVPFVLGPDIVNRIPVEQGPMAITTSSTQCLSSTEEVPGSNVPYTTHRSRVRKEQRELLGIFKRKYERKSDFVTCKKCKKDRKPPSHKQYFGNWYCDEMATISFEDWRNDLFSKGYGRRDPRPKKKD